MIDVRTPLGIFDRRHTLIKVQLEKFILNQKQNSGSIQFVAVSGFI